MTQTEAMATTDGWDPPRPGWTCPECGFVYDDTDPSAASTAINDLGRRYRVPLTRGLKNEDLDTVLRTRPEPDVWSALEYACHVRDALGLYRYRVDKALSEDSPEVPAMGRDQVVVDSNYNSQGPATVADELADAAGRLADLLATVESAAWDRAVVRDGERLTVDWMARNALHEGVHHLLDVGRALRHVRGR
jgi:hypothetical protein